jgi:hypothetical protein
MTRRGRGRSRPGGLWLLFVPVICCAGPLVVAGLAAAGALAWGGLGLAAAVLPASALLVIRRRRARAADTVCGAPSQPGPGRPAIPAR